MAMVNSLFTAISGMRNHQAMLDVIANNVANTNTTGFKAGRVQFADLLSQTVSTAVGSNPLNNRGGINPVQVGLGGTVASIDTIFSQGTLQVTNNPTDMAITGDGFFAVKQGNETLYTRAGGFSFDSAGRLVDASGGLVQGWTAEAPTRVDGTIDPLAKKAVDSSNTTNIDSITINTGMTLQPNQTTRVELAGNLDAGANAANLGDSAGIPGTVALTVQDDTPFTAPTTFNYVVGQHTMNFIVFDSLGNEHKLNMTLTNLSGTQLPSGPVGTLYENNTWAWEVSVDPSDTTVEIVPDNITYTDPVSDELIRTSHSGLIHFNTNGSLDYVTYRDANIPGAGTAGVWGITADENEQTVIGFEGVVVPAGNATEDVVTNTPTVAPFFDNPASETITEGALLPTPRDIYSFELNKLPIVLSYQTFVAPQTPLPSSVTAGTLVNGLNYIGLNTTPGFNPIVPEMTTTPATTPVAAYLQKIDIDFGSVSTITNADFDWLRQNNPGTPLGFPLEFDDGQLVPPPPPPPILPPSVLPDDVGVGRLGDGDRDVTFGLGNLGGPQPMTLSLVNGQRDGLTQDTTGEFQFINGKNVYVPNYAAFMRSQDGYASGILQTVQVDPTGKIVGAFTNGQTQELAQVAIATFQNPSGLSKVGGVHFVPTSNSGLPILGTALTGGRGSVVGGALEQSNVDLAKELTDMIIAQRGFEVNARLVSTSDRILDTLVNLGR